MGMERLAPTFEDVDVLITMLARSAVGARLTGYNTWITCPCYREIGGHGYGSIYPGPLGAVLSPLMGGYKAHKDLPYVCTLCSA